MVTRTTASDVNVYIISDDLTIVSAPSSIANLTVLDRNFTHWFIRQIPTLVVPDSQYKLPTLLFSFGVSVCRLCQ